MPAVAADTSARDAIDAFTGHLADQGFAASTRRVRRHFLHEYLRHSLRAAQTHEMTVGQLLDPARTDAWLTDAGAGKTRIRNTLRGPTAAAYPNSMRARVNSFNAFVEFLGFAERIDGHRPARGFYLTPGDTERLLHDLTVRRPINANAMTALRTAALAALVADTGRGVPELAHLKVAALHLDRHLDREPHVDLEGESCPLSDATVHILTRWLATRATIIAELEGSDPGHLWIPTKPGRPRGSDPAVKPGINHAAVRTLHAAHRTLVSQLLGTPLRPGALRSAHDEASTVRSE